MASKIECPKCGGASNSLVHGVCRACFMRDFHQKRSASAATECPRCGTVTANFVRGVCRVCYMRDYHQKRAASSVTDGEGQGLCVECREAGIYARGLCRPCYLRGYRQKLSALDKQSASDEQRVSETPTFICESEGGRVCAECKEPSTYSRGLCHTCYVRDNRRRHRMKPHTCVICGVSFQAARRDALYCSMTCRCRAYRVRNASSTTATTTSSAAYATTSAAARVSTAAKVSAAVTRALYRPRRVLSVYRPVAVVPDTRQRS